MKKVFLNILYICIGIFAFVMASSVTNYFMSQRNSKVGYDEAAYEVVDEVVDDIMDMSQNYNNKYKYKNINEGAKEFLKKKAEKINDLEKKYMFFASFVGFKYRQTVLTYNYCNLFGVKIDNFVRLFNELNDDVSVVVNNEMPENFESMVIIPATIEALSKLTKDEFQEIQIKNGLNSKDICLIINKPQKEAADYMTFSKMLPDSYKFIMNYSEHIDVILPAQN